MNKLKITILSTLIMLLSISTIYANDFGLIEVSGTETISIQPDTATINVTVSKKDKKRETAKQEVVDTVNKFSEELIKSDLSLTKDDIKSNNLYIYPEYDRETYTEVIGYVATQDVVIVLDNLNYISEVIDILTSYEGVTNSYINYTISNYDEVYNMALVGALQNAISKGQALSDAMGVGATLKIANVLETTATGGYYKYTNTALLADSQEMSSVNINPTYVDITANVNVVFTY